MTVVAFRRPLLCAAFTLLSLACSKPAPPPAPTATAAPSSETAEKHKGGKASQPKAESSSSADDDGDDDGADPSAKSSATASDFAFKIAVTDTKVGDPPNAVDPVGSSSATGKVTLGYKLGGAGKSAAIETFDLAQHGAYGLGDAMIVGGKPAIDDVADDAKTAVSHAPKGALRVDGFVYLGERAWFRYRVYTLVRVDDHHCKVVLQDWQNGEDAPETEATITILEL